MQTAEYDVASFEHQAQSEEDKKLLVKFFVKPRQDNAETIKQGRPIFKDVEYIDIKIPGDRTGGVCRPATHVDKQRFGEHYKAFKNRTEVPLEGTPLTEWPLITRSLAEELAFHHVKTVEQLSTMSDTHSGKFMGLNSLKAKALKWLEQAGEEAKVHQLQHALGERDERIAEQGTQIETLQKQMLELMGNKEMPSTQPPSQAGLDATPLVGADSVMPALSSALDEPVAAAPEATETVEPAEPEAEQPKRRRRRKKVDDDDGNAI